MLRRILFYTLITVSLVFEGFFGIISLVSFLLQVILIVGATQLFWMMFGKKHTTSFRDRLLSGSLRLMATLGFFIGLFLGWMSYQNYISPGIISNTTLTHSGQTVVFVEMSHIATPDFYEHQREKISSLAKNGYKIIMEGVHSGSIENEQKFDALMGFDFTPDLYSEIAGLIGLTAQDNRHLYAGISTGSLVSVDLSIDDIIGLMGTGVIGGAALTDTGSIGDLEGEIRSMSSELSASEKIFLGWTARGFLNWSIKQSDNLEYLLSGENTKKELFSIIVNKRNDVIVNYILSHPGENIVIVYGSLHFNGIYESLQRHETGWNITHIETLKPYGY